MGVRLSCKRKNNLRRCWAILVKRRRRRRKVPAAHKKSLYFIFNTATVKYILVCFFSLSVSLKGGIFPALESQAHNYLLLDSMPVLWSLHLLQMQYAY